MQPLSELRSMTLEDLMTFIGELSKIVREESSTTGG